MLKPVVHFAEYLGKRPKRSIVAAGAVIVLLIGVPDFFLGQRIGFSIFYLIPISLVTWYAGRRAGGGIAALSAAIWMAADIATRGWGHPAYIPLWNAVVRLGLFMVVVILLNAFKREKSFAREDYLTGLGNRRHFFELADAELKRCRRYGHPFSVGYIDVDDFKAVNDRFGHAEGDQLLKITGQAIASTIRETDIAARLGGDEFAVLLPESDVAPASRFFGKLHNILSAVVRNSSWPVSFSIGVVTFVRPPESVDEMIRAVDRLMYEAKEGGKNRIKCELYE